MPECILCGGKRSVQDDAAFTAQPVQAVCNFFNLQHYFCEGVLNANNSEKIQIISNREMLIIVGTTLPTRTDYREAEGQN